MCLHFHSMNEFLCIADGAGTLDATEHQRVLQYISLVRRLGEMGWFAPYLGVAMDSREMEWSSCLRLITITRSRLRREKGGKRKGKESDVENQSTRERKLIASLKPSSLCFLSSSTD